MGPGATLQIFDAAQSAPDGESIIKEYTGYSGILDNDLILETSRVGVAFYADNSALPVSGPKITYTILKSNDDGPQNGIQRILLIGGILLGAAYVVLAALAWRRYKAMEARQQQQERDAARYAHSVHCAL
jgi:predicted outer membrane lipoprotein